CALVFFVSSRRRHTRSKRDWSSDVCSSDLVARGSVAVSGSLPGGSWSSPLQSTTAVVKRTAAAGRRVLSSSRAKHTLLYRIQICIELRPSNRKPHVRVFFPLLPWPLGRPAAAMGFRRVVGPPGAARRRHRSHRR